MTPQSSAKKQAFPGTDNTIFTTGVLIGSEQLSDPYRLEGIIPSTSSHSSKIEQAGGGVVDAPNKIQHIETSSAATLEPTYWKPFSALKNASSQLFYSTLGQVAASSAAYAAIPEAIGDALHLSGLMTERKASYVTAGINYAVTFFSGGWVGAASSLATQKIMRNLIGCSEPNARIAGNAASFFVNTVKNCTPVGLASTAANYAGGYIGVCTEKWVARRFASRR